MWRRCWKAASPTAATGCAPGATAAAPCPGPRDAHDEAWQAALWRRIDAAMGVQAQHPAQAFVDALQRGGETLARRAGLPARAHVFALPGIAPLHLQLLQQLSPWMELHLYVLNPCREYWFELVDRRRLSHLAAIGRDGGHEEGNRLLASWGKATQVHVEALVELLGEAADDEACSKPAPGDGLLQRLQNAVLELQPIEPGSLSDGGSRPQHRAACVPFADARAGGAARPPARACSRSRRLHRSPATSWWSTPDLDRAAPLIDADLRHRATRAPHPLHRRRALAQRAEPVGARVAGVAGAGRLRAAWPARSSRCCSSRSSRAASAWTTRRWRSCTAGCAMPASIGPWMRSTWPAWTCRSTPRHTLDDALQRLFLGHALPEDNDAPFAGLLGAGNAEGSTRVGARRVLALRRGAAAFAARAAGRPRSPEAWAAPLFELLDASPSRRADELDDQRELQAAIRQLVGRHARRRPDAGTAAGGAARRAAPATRRSGARRCRRRQRHLRVDEQPPRPALRGGVCHRPERRRLSERERAAGIRPDGEAPAARRPPAPRRAARAAARPAARRAPPACT